MAQEVPRAVQASAAAKDPQTPRPLTVDRALELLAVFVIATGLIGLAAALAGLFRVAQLLLIGICATWAYAWWTRRRPVETVVGPSGRHLLLILLVAAFFRLPAYNYVLGGQDEGLYVNMANHLARTGSILPEDSVRLALHDPSAAARYIQDNYQPRNYLAGVYRTGGDAPRLVFQFYHLFPVWMALFGGLFGLPASVYALTFLGLVSLLFSYRLVLALTNSRPAALAGGLLLAVNPLHAFFSKFPVSEVPALAFSSIGFAFLAIYWRSAPPARRRRCLALAAFALLCLFTTRISGFLYLPFLLLLSVAALFCDPDRARGRAIHRWVLAVFGLFALSVMYGLRWSGFYSRDVYRFSFELLFARHWRAGLLACALVAVSCWFGIWLASGSEKLRGTVSRTLMQARNLIGPALVLVVLLGFYRVYQLGFTTRYVGDPWMDEWTGLAGTRWRAVTTGSLVVSAQYLSPVLFLTFLFLSFRRWREPAMAVLLSFVSFFAAHLALLEWYIPYQPYYARYLVSEFVPYAILSVVCAWAYLQAGKARLAVGAVLLLSGLYGVALSAMQVGKQENEGTYESLAPLAARLDRRDLLLIDDANVRGFFISEFKTPLVYTFGLRVADISSESLAEPSYMRALRGSFDDIYLISSAGNPPTGFAPVDSFRFWVMAFQHDYWPPTELYTRIDSRLYMYRLEPIELSAGVRVDFRVGGLGIEWLQNGWSAPEPWGIWAVGHSATMRIDRRSLAGNPPIVGLRFQLNAFVAPQHPEQHVAIRVDGIEVQRLHFRYPDAVDLQADVPLNRVSSPASRPITIEFGMPQAASPASVGMGRETRVIGIGLKSLELLGKTSPLE